MSELLKYSDIKDWDAKTIDSKVSEIRKDLFNKKMQKVTSGIEKPHVLKVLKKNIARLKTAKNLKK